MSQSNIFLFAISILSVFFIIFTCSTLHLYLLYKLVKSMDNNNNFFMFIFNPFRYTKLCWDIICNKKEVPENNKKWEKRMKLNFKIIISSWVVLFLIIIILVIIKINNM